jgi:hypothetical protein
MTKNQTYSNVKQATISLKHFFETMESKNLIQNFHANCYTLKIVFCNKLKVYDCSSKLKIKANVIISVTSAELHSFQTGVMENTFLIFKTGRQILNTIINTFDLAYMFSLLEMRFENSP